MLPFVGRRALTAIPTLFIVTLMVFAIQRSLPGDPALILAGEQQDPEVIAFIRERYRLDDPVPVQYLAWLGQLARGDLGRSLRTNERVLDLIGSKLPVTIELAVLSMLVALVIALPIGVLAAVRRGTSTSRSYIIRRCVFHCAPSRSAANQSSAVAASTNDGQ